MISQITAAGASPAVASALIAAANQVIDLDELRMSSLENYVPAPLILLLIGVAAIAMAFLGWSFGAAEERSNLSMLLLSFLLTAVTWPLEIDRTPHVDYLKGLWATLESHTNGYYMNDVADEAQSVVDQNYQGNIGRMRAVKKQYDPMNLFRLNANVQPA